MRQVRRERNDNFYFLSFSAFSKKFWLEMKPNWYFFNFLNFLAIFLDISITGRVGTKRNETTIFIFSLSQPFPTYFGLKWSSNGIFQFFEFFCFFFNFLLRVGQERNGTIIFIFTLPLPFPKNFSLKCSHNGSF